MAKFYNLHYVSDLAAYTKGQGIPHFKPSPDLKLGTIISYNESDAPDSPEDPGVPFGVSVKTIPADSTTQVQYTMKSDGASHICMVPSFIHPENHMVIKKVDVNTGELVDNDMKVAAMPAHLKFSNPDMVPNRR